MQLRPMASGSALSFTALVVLVISILACGGTPTGSLQGGAEAPSGGPPDFTLTDLAGNMVRLSDSNGTVRLVGFWATWCAPCVEEIPALKDLQASYKDRGLTILMVAMDDEGAEVVKPFAEKRDIDYPVLLGKEETPHAFGGIAGLPTAFILDRDGKVVDRILGAVPRAALEGKVKKALGITG